MGFEHMQIGELQAQIFVTEFDIKSSTEYLQELLNELVKRNVTQTGLTNETSQS